MLFRFAAPKLEDLYQTGQSADLHPHVVKAFFKVMARIRAANNALALRKNTGLHMEKLKGDRAGQYSVRLNEQFRLIFTIEHDAEGNVLVLIEIVDYH